MTSSLQLNLDDPQNLVARRTTALPGVVHAFGPEDCVQQTSTARLAAHMGIVQALCIAQVDATTGLASFISMARKRARPTFTTRDRQLLQLASAHLGAAPELCLAQTLDRDGNGLSQTGGRLASDASVVLTAIQPGTLALLRMAELVRPLPATGPVGHPPSPAQRLPGAQPARAILLAPRTALRQPAPPAGPGSPHPA